MSVTIFLIFNIFFMAKVMTKLGELEVPGGKTWEAKGQAKIKDGTMVTTFRAEDKCKFTYADAPKPEKDGDAAPKQKHKMYGKTVVMHVLDAAILEKMGKGKIIKGSEKEYQPK